MTTPNAAAIGVATVAAFIVSAGWYAVLDGPRVALLGLEVAAAPSSPPAWKLGVELTRSLVVATGLAFLVAALNVSSLSVSLPLAIAVWVALPVTLLVGSVVWDDVPVALAAIHAGDWLAKLLVVTAIVTLWR